jgi:hypothetical protein
MLNGPCDVEVSDSSGAIFYGRLTGAEAAARLREHADKRCRLRVRPWEASADDHESLRVYQIDLIKTGKTLTPF